MSNTILELKNVTKKYGKKTIIDDLSLSIEAGQVYGFLGPNGAGKTTTIKMIVGLIDIDNGSISINGLDVKKKFENAIKNVGAIVENPDLYRYLTGMQNIKLFARLHNVKKERIEEVVKLVDLKSRINDKVQRYSLGMKQRLGIAIALLHNPKLLILDEPTNGLDPAGIKSLRDTLKQLAHKKGITVFVSSHLLSEMQLMCDSVAIIDNGKIIKVESLGAVEKLNNEYIFNVSDIEKSINILKEKCSCSIKEKCLVLQYDGKVSDILKELTNNDIEIFSFNKKENTLEEDFLNSTGGVK